MNFTINQTNGIRETVNSEFINKLYNLFITNRSSHTISLSGYLYSPTGYKAQMDALNQQYGPDLVIEVPAAGQYILIEDPAVLQILLDNNISSDGIGISVADADIATFTASNSGGTFKSKTNITSFNTFNYFTRANTNPPSQLFSGCSNLESINLTEALKLSGSEFQYSGVKDLNAPKLREMGIWCFAESYFETGTNLGQITLIPSYAFYKCSQLKSMNLPQSCETLDESAFSAYNTSYSRQFTTINIDNITSFGKECFYGQSMLEINASEFNSEVYSIGQSAFNNCLNLSGILNLKNLVTLGSTAFYETHIQKVLSLGKITAIPSSVFSSWANSGNKATLKEVYLPQECISIGQEAFCYRTGLTTVKQYNLSTTNENWVAGENYKDLSSITQFGQSCFSQCTSLSLTANELRNATLIGKDAFMGCFLLSGSVIFNSLTSLGSRAFYQTGVTEVNLSNTQITSIPSQCFFGCSSLTSISLPSSCTELGDGCFAGDGNLTIPIEDLQYIETMRGGRDTHTFGVYNSSYSNYAKLSGTNLYLPNLKHIELGTFRYQNNITTVNLPGLTYMHAGAVFYACTNLLQVLSLGNITEFNTSDTNYGYRGGVFGSCTNLQKVVLPNVRNIPVSMFDNCYRLSDLNLPSSITNIGSYAFSRTNGLTNKVMYFPNVTTIGAANTFGNTAGMHIYLPKLIEFKDEGGWNNNTFGNSRPSWEYGPIALFCRYRDSIMTSPYTRTFYVKDLQNIPAGLFYKANIDTIIINNVNVPTLIESTVQEYINNGCNSTIFKGYTTIGTIYVPDSAYQDYYDSPLFADVQSKLERLSLCPRITLAQAEAGGTGIIEDYM